MVQGSGGIWCGFASPVVTLASGKGQLGWAPQGWGQKGNRQKWEHPQVCARWGRQRPRNGRWNRQLELSGGCWWHPHRWL